MLRDRVFRLQAAGTPWGNTSWDRVVSPRAAGIPRLDATSSWKRPRCSLKSSWNPRLLITCCWNTHPRLASLEYRSPDTNLLKAPTGGQTPAPDLAFYCHVFMFRRTNAPSELQTTTEQPCLTKHLGHLRSADLSWEPDPTFCFSPSATSFAFY